MDTVFFITSKLLWGLAQPETLLMLLIAAAWLTLRRRPGLSRGMLTVALAVMVISSIWPVQNLLLAPLESRYTRPADPGRIDGILVLGGGELTDLTLTHDQSQTNSAGERFTEALALALRHPEAAVIFTGGSGALMGAPPGALVAVPEPGGAIETTLAPVNGPPVAPAVMSTVTGVAGPVVTACATGIGSGFTVTVTVAGAELPPGPEAM